MTTTSFKQQNSSPTGIFLWAVTGYVILLTIANLLESGILKGLSYGAAFGIFMLMAIVSAFSPRQKNLFTGFGLALCFYYYGIIGSILYNIHSIDWAVALKMLMAPLFILFGSLFESQSREGIWTHKNVKTLFMMLIIFPFCLWVWQLATGRVTFGSSGEVSIFANRNNAALYAVTLLALYNVLSSKPIKSFLVYIFAGVCFGTLGVLLAIMIAILVTLPRAHVLRFSILFATLAFFAFLAWLINPELGVFARLVPVVDSIRYIFTGQIVLSSVTYAELVQILHTSDLSFIFRLKHWLDLLTIYADGSIFEWVFGFGIGSSAHISDKHLVPHNDYLRYLFECGVVTFIGFVLLIGIIIAKSGRRWEAVPLFVIAIYFFSENLVANFVAMALFYFCAGALLQRFWREKQTKSYVIKAVL